MSCPKSGIWTGSKIWESEETGCLSPRHISCFASCGVGVKPSHSLGQDLGRLLGRGPQVTVEGVLGPQSGPWGHVKVCGAVGDLFALRFRHRRSCTGRQPATVQSYRCCGFPWSRRHTWHLTRTHWSPLESGKRKDERKRVPRGPAPCAVGWAGALPEKLPTSGQWPWVWFVVTIMLVMMKREFSSCRAGGGERARPCHPGRSRAGSRRQLDARLTTGQGLSRLPRAMQKTV